MSGYRAAPKGARVTVYGVDPPWRYVVRPSGQWFDERADDAPVRKMLGLTLDALYYARLTALDSAAAACEAIGDARGAEAVRRLKETT